MAWNGWNFRSQAEAYAAMFLGKLGIEFMYEPEAYSLDDGSEPTRPDFWLPEINGGVWLEIKGRDTFDDRQASRLSSVQPGVALFVAVAPLWVKASNGRTTNNLLKYENGIRADVQHELCRCARCTRWTIQYRGYQSRHDCGLANRFTRDNEFAASVDAFERATAEKIAEAGRECERFRVWSTVGR